MTSSERSDLQTSALPAAETAVCRDGCEASELRREITERDREIEVLKRELAEAREEQAATGEILRVISGSPTELQRVLDALVQSAARLCNANDAAIFCVDGDTMWTAAHHGSIPTPHVDERFPIRRDIATGRA